MTWHAYLVRTLSGDKGRRITPDTGGGGTWSITLNGIEDVSVQVDAAALRRLERKWWAPWKGSVLLTHTGPEGEVPVILGPIVKPVTQKGQQVTLTVRGVGALLSRRVLLARDYVHDGDTPPAASMEALAASTVSLAGRSLGTIGQDVVELVTTEKVAGQLPIRYGTPRETGPGLNERNYHGYNLANNGAWKRLTELSDVRNGPDFMFRPAWANDERTRVEWVMVNGTANQPTIHQERRVLFDATSTRAAIADVSVATDAGDMTLRAYWTGAGEDSGTLVRVAQDIDALGDDMPLLESVGSTSDSDNQALVQEHARGALSDGLTAHTQFSGVVDLSDRRTAPGMWHVGDAADLVLAGRIDVPNGRRQVRIIAAKGSLGSDQVTLEMEEEVAPNGEAA